MLQFGPSPNSSLWMTSALWMTVHPQLAVVRWVTVAVRLWAPHAARLTPLGKPGDTQLAQSIQGGIMLFGGAGAME